MYSFLTTENWADYELVDSGNFEKLERFGAYYVARPEPQAIWDKHLPEQEWQRLAQATFTRDKGSQEKGQWKLKKGMPEQWYIDYKYNDLKLRFRLGLSSFKHVGIFPEQDPNWKYIYDTTRKLQTQPPKVLNMFAYTGAATLAAKAAGADVTHLDSIKQVNFWARDNMEASHLDNVRWVVEDAMKYARREVKRGNTYNGIILDPPSYGRGPNNEKWQLEDELNEMIKLCRAMLHDTDYFLLINLYSMGFSGMVLDNLLRGTFGDMVQHEELGELYLLDGGNRKLPLGTFFRFSSVGR